jgi:PAS domain S-box-containing protein
MSLIDSTSAATADGQDLPVEADLILDAVGTAVAVIDARSTLKAIVRVNPAFSSLTGYPAAQVLGRHPAVLAGPQTDPVIRQQVLQAVDQRAAFGAEWLIHRADGSPLWTRLGLQPLRDTGSAGSFLVLTLEDISDFKRARESLRVSEGRLEVAMAAGGLAMWDWNIPRDEISYNDRWREVLGVSASELLARKELSERLMLPSDPDILERFEQHFRGQAPAFDCEYQLRARDGTLKSFHAHAKVVRRDAKGAPLRMIGVLRDVSTIKESLEQAHEAQRRWERAVRGTSDGLYDWDLATGHVWYAQRFREIVGREQGGFPDTFQAFQDALHPDDRGLVLGKIRAHLENRAKLDVRCRVRTPSGEVIWCRLRGEAERDAAGRPLRLSGSISDIGAQIEAEEALLRSQDFFGTILDSLPLSIAYLEDSLRLTYANRAFQELFGAPLTKCRGMHMRAVLGAERYGAIADSFTKALEGQTLEGHLRSSDANGRDYELEVAFIPERDEAGAIRGCFFAARDVTEKRQLEAELRQSQKMEAIGHLTGSVAHDFNNLLSIVVGNLQLLARSLHADAHLLRQADTALSAALRGGELTRRLLAFARQQVLEPRTVDLNQLIGEMHDLLRRVLSSEFELQCRLEPNVWPTRLDVGQLENAMLNLVINARDAMPQGGVITISTRNAAVGVNGGPREEGVAAGEYVVVEVADTGVGIPESLLKRVFEPFFTTKEVGKGSGLGLSIVYGFAKQSGGHVRISSTPGAGTRVMLYFPRVHGLVEPRSAQADETMELPRGSETILVVEDDAEVRATAVDILRSLGYHPLEAASGPQAIEHFIRHPEIALVFADVMLPGGMHGTELARKLRERRPGLKVLLTSGFGEGALIERGLSEGPVELLAKPYKVEELARRVRARLDAG